MRAVQSSLYLQNHADEAMYRAVIDYSHIHTLLIYLFNLLLGASTKKNIRISSQAIVFSVLDRSQGIGGISIGYLGGTEGEI